MGISNERRRAPEVPSRKHQGKLATKVRFGRTTVRWFNKNLAKEDVGRVWYQKEDFYRIHCNNHAQIRGALGIDRKGYPKPYAVPFDEETMNVRGLEHHFNGNSYEKKRRRRQHARCLLHAQNANVTNAHELRDYAAYMSDFDQRRAQRIAGYDAFEAFRVHREAGTVFHNKVYAEFTNVPKPVIMSSHTPRQRSITAQLA